MCFDYAGMRENYLQRWDLEFCEWNEWFRAKTEIGVVDKFCGRQSTAGDVARFRSLSGAPPYPPHTLITVFIN